MSALRAERHDKTGRTTGEHNVTGQFKLGYNGAERQSWRKGQTIEV